MQLRLKTVLASLAIFSSGILAVPVDASVQAQHSSNLQRRVVTPRFTFSGDLADLPLPDPADKNYKKKMDTLTNHKQPGLDAKRAPAKAVVITLLTAAQARYPIPDDIVVDISNSLHSSKDEATNHVTFTFVDPGVCGAGRCRGHAFEHSAGRPGDIFNGANHKIFP
ncbi:hypothetical protein ONZ45_g17280 [Pleurotus djamor]|nr:hypothetical protein ONZ45_g17280 [Pleurotus djamor]